MKESEYLDAIADKVEPPGAWTQGTFARNAKGQETQTQSDDAVSWCWYGARHALAPPADQFIDVGRYMNKALSGRDVMEFNDNSNTTQAMVVAATRRAADLARRDGR
jgi:hypothetical protein